MSVLKDEICRLDSFVSDALSANADGYENIRDWEQQVKGFCTELKDAFSQTLFSSLEENALDRYFKFHLQGVRQSLDTLFFNKRTKSCHPGAADFLCLELCSLIDFMIVFCGTYFPFDCAAPQVYSNRLIAFAGDDIKIIQLRLDTGGLHPQLKKSLLSYLGSFQISSYDACYTYRELLYLKKMISGLMAASRADALTLHEETITAGLKAINFNQLLFFNYCRNQITDQLKPLSAEQKLEKLKEEKEQLLMQKEPAVFYDAAWPSLCKMLTQWINEELSQPGLSAALAEPIETATKSKLGLNLSVAQIACMVRVFMDAGIFTENNVQHIVRFVAEHFKSKRQEMERRGT